MGISPYQSDRGRGPDNAHPKYKAASSAVEQSGGGKNMFEDIGEAEGFGGPSGKSRDLGMRMLSG